MIDLNTTWFILVGVLLTGYAILDGFDLGVGALHLFVKKDEHRRLFLNSIGPVWDGNEVWLVTGGGALFAAFPEAYADGVLRILPAVHAAAVLAHLSGGGDRVPQQGAVGLVAADVGHRLLRGQRARPSSSAWRWGIS